MSEEQFRYNVHLLENINGTEALVDADKLEYLNSDNVWTPISKLGIEYIPIILYTTHNIDKDMSRISYTLHYELLIPHITVTPMYYEQIVITASDNEELPFKKRYIKQKNTDLNQDALIRYNNKEINTFSKVKNSVVMCNYKSKSKRKLYSIANIISKSITKN